MKFLRKFVVIGTQDSGDTRVFAYLSYKKDALEYAAKFAPYKHVEVFERITEGGKVMPKKT